MKRLLVASLIAFAACTPPQAQAPAEPAVSVALAPQDIVAFFDCLRTSGSTIAAAHRGGPSPGYAENAVETFAHVASEIPALLEIDIARTKDGQLVLMHDDELDRTTTGSGLVRDRTLAEIPAERKNTISHRARAAQAARELLMRWIAAGYLRDRDSGGAA